MTDPVPRPPLLQQALLAAVASAALMGLAHAHSQGLIPVIDCQSQVLAPEKAPRLKLIAPKRWNQASITLQAALSALRPASRETEQRIDEQGHLAHPFAAPPR